MVLVHSWEPNVFESFNSNISKWGYSWILITFSNSTFRSWLNLTIVFKVQLGENKQTNIQKGKEMWEERVYKIERNGLTFCIPKENKERNGDGGKEERWDFENLTLLSTYYVSGSARYYTGILFLQSFLLTKGGTSCLPAANKKWNLRTTE